MAPEVAQDVVQDVLCRVWQLGAAWHPQGSARSYLYASVRNAVLNRRKHEVIAARFEDEALRTAAHGGAVESPSAERMVEARERTDALRRQIDALPERQRAALALRYEEQLTVPEVAATLGITVKAAENLLARTVKALRARVGDEPALVERHARRVEPPDPTAIEIPESRTA